MMQTSVLRKTFVYISILFLAIAQDALAQRGGRGGGGRMGGGGGAMRGGMGGGQMGGRPAMPAQRPQLQQRPAQSPVQRPQVQQRPQVPQRQAQAPARSPIASAPGSRPGVANRPSQLGRPAQLPTRGGVAGRPSQLPNQGQNMARPNQNQLSQFLGEGYSPRTTSGGRPTAGMASQLPTTGGSRQRNLENGGSVSVDRGAGQVTGPGGNTVGGAGRQVTITGPGGESVARRSGVVGATNGQNAAIAGRRTTVAHGDRGTVANSRSAYANTLGQWGLGGATAIQGRNGYTAVNVRGAVGVAGVGGRAGSITAIRGPGGTTIAHGRGASYANGQFVHGHAWGAVNGSYQNWRSFYGGWSAGYPGCWWPGKWAVAATAMTWAAWQTSSWETAAPYAYPEEVPAEPIYYDYGNNVTYEEGNVYYGEVDQGTSQDYYDAALHSAQEGDVAPQEEEWFPLGVFAVVEKTSADQEGENQKSETVLQLAINKEAIIRGNFQKTSTSDPIEVRGSVDKDTQRVLIQKVGDDVTVLETGLYNLTNDEAPALLQLGPTDHVELVLIRLNNPNLATNQSD